MKTRFIKACLLAFIVCFLGIAGFCYVVDPFGIYLRFKIAGVNEAKPFAGKYTQIWKPYSVYLQRPDGIILGSSQLMASMDPHHPGLAPLAKKVYNLAIPSGNMYAIYRYFLHARTVNPLSLVIIGLDPSMFYRPLKYDFNSPALLTQPGSLPYIFFKLCKETLFSFVGLKTSWATLMSQEKVLSPQEGFHNSWSLKIINRQLLRVGHRKWFKIMERKLAHDLLRRGKNPWEFSQKGKGAAFQKLREILQYCLKSKTRLILFINPTHARAAELVRVRGDWLQYENWKRALVRVVAEETENAPENLVAIWDFGVYNSVTNEPLPPPGDKKTLMKYYWETFHYNISTGNLILNRVLNYKETGREVPHDFGIRLTLDNIDSHLKSDREKQKIFIRNNPDFMLEVLKNREKDSKHVYRRMDRFFGQ